MNYNTKDPTIDPTIEPNLEAGLTPPPSTKVNILIYVINLDKDADRLKEMEQKLSPNTFTRIPAIYGNTDNMTKYENILPTSHYFTPKSVLATGLSHKKAIETYLQDLEKNHNHNDHTIGLILEDDAIPLNTNYMKEIETIIKNAPEDWEIIKLDYLPKFTFNTYNKIPTILFTAYLINEKGAMKYKNSFVSYHVDMEVWCKNIVVYNTPTTVFKQIWNNENGSNNQIVKWYNPITKMSYIANYKVIRIGTNEYTIADLILFIIIFLFLFIVGNLRFPYKLKNTDERSEVVFLLFSGKRP
jgi:GR25 family glycosyltransferase involved in LPS biosynthesis